jgi:multicomponent Na+:H+ antiporter subunit B
MRMLAGLTLLTVVGFGVAASLEKVPFGAPRPAVGAHYVEKGRVDTGAANIVTSVVVGYRSFDTLGEVTVLFAAAVGLGALVAGGGRDAAHRDREPASRVLRSGCRLLFPLILLFGAYIFINGHLTPGGGFQGGAIIASGFLLVYLGCRGRRIRKTWSNLVESSAGLVFVGLGLAGLTAAGHCFLFNFLPRGSLYSLLSAGIIPLIYIAIGFKVGTELTGVIDDMLEETG